MAQKEKNNTDEVIKKIKGLASRVFILNAAGKWNKSLELFEQAYELIRNFQENLPSELEEPHCVILYSNSSIFLKRGLLGRHFKWLNEYSTIAKKYGNKKHIAISTYFYALHYLHDGDLDKALKHIERAIMLIEDCYNNDNRFPLYYLTEIYHHAIRIAIERKEFERTGPYLKRLKEIYELRSNDPALHLIYQLSRATILKSSKRARDRVKAEEIYKKVCKSETRLAWIRNAALIGRCELLLIELKSTDEIEIIDEIKPLLEDIIDLAQQNESDFFLLGAYVLQGKLALLTFDMKIARRFLIQGQRIAERRGYKTIAEEIAQLHEELKGNLDEWEGLKQQNAPLSERIKLVRLNEDLGNQFGKRTVNMEQVVEKKVTVYSEVNTCVVCKGSAAGFNIYVCPQCSSIYCKGCAEAVVELENACWTCESPIDKTKPSQLLEKKEDKIKFEAKDGKKAPKNDIK